MGQFIERRGLMQRTPQHETDSAGQRLVRQAIEPLGWVVRSVTEQDYGIDFEIEVFQRRTPGGALETTGLTFKAQLKSSKATHYSAAGDFISETMALANLQYLAKELNAPTILVHADVSTGRLFWHAPQLDKALASSLLKRAEQDGTATVRISTSNELPGTADRLLEALGQAASILASRAVATASDAQFFTTFAGRDNADLLRAMRAKTDLLALAEADRLRLEDRRDQSRALLDGLLQCPDASIETKFAAQLLLEPLETVARIRGGRPDHERQSVGLEAAVHLYAIAKDGPPYLRLFAIIRKAIGELDLLLYQDWGLFLNWTAHESTGDEIWRATVLLRRAMLADRLARKYRQCVRLVNVGLRSRYAWALPDAILRLSHTALTFATQARAQGHADAAANMQRHALEVCQAAGTVALQSGDEYRTTNAAMGALIVDTRPTSDAHLWAKGIMGAVQDPDLRRRFDEQVERLQRRRKGESFPDDIKTTNSQIYEIMANALGIDLSDDKNPIARMVRIGIEDLNPERVLRECEHIQVRMESAGVVAGALRLPTAGRKSISCSLHAHALSTLSLDAGHSLFKQQFCSRCPDRAPRPPDWSWQPEGPRDE